MQRDMENIFKIHAYGRTELALMYFPQFTPDSAWKKLRSWIERCKGLNERLKELEYDSNRRSFTPAEVKAIVDFLDEP